MKQLLLLILIVLITGCEEPVDWNLKSKATNLLVVDGMLTDEYKPHCIRLTRTVEQLNQKPEAVSGAIVRVFDEKQFHVFTESPVGSGYYYSDSMAAGINRKYTLGIQYNGVRYNAMARMAVVDYFEPLTYVAAEDSGMYELDWQPDVFNPDKPAMWEIIIDWSHLPAYSTVAPDDCKVRLLFYTLTTIDVSQIFKPEQMPVVFPKGSIITQRKYSLTERHEDFIRSLLAETEWRGGYFDVVPANVNTNLSEGAIGYFSVCAVKSIVLVVQ